MTQGIDLNSLLQEEGTIASTNMNIESLINGDSNKQEVKTEAPASVIAETKQEVAPEVKQEVKTEAPASVVTDVQNVTEEPVAADSIVAEIDNFDNEEEISAEPEKEAKKTDTIGIQMPSDDKYLKDLQTYTWVEDDMTGKVRIYKISSGKLYEERSKYRYLAPEMLENMFGAEISGFLELGGSFVFSIKMSENLFATVNDTITGYYPGVVTVTDAKTGQAVSMRIRHTANQITDLTNLLIKAAEADSIDSILAELANAEAES